MGFQALEHFIAGVHKRNANAQAILLTADTHIRNEQNPIPGAQMLVICTKDQNHDWEAHLQKCMVSVYQAVELANRGTRLRGGLSNE